LQFARQFAIMPWATWATLKGVFYMAIKDLPQDYQPAAGDWRIQDKQDGTFSNAVYTGATWAEMQPIPSGRPIGAVVEGLTSLGRRDRAYYYRAEPEPGRAGQWPWTVQKNEGNAGWTPPRFSFGQLVWDRRNPTKAPLMVTGICFEPAYNDQINPMSEDEDESTPQTWAYLLGRREAEVGEEDLLARADLARVLAYLNNDPAPGVAGGDFDPFLDADYELP
jgi:hypothetical protein